MNIISPDEINFEQYLADHPEHAKVVPAWTYVGAVEDWFYGDRPNRGALLPWSKTHSQIRLRPGEVSIWAGVNGHGKSLLLNQIMLGVMARGHTACIASMEMKPEATLARMCRQAAGGQPSREFIQKFHEWIEDRLWIYDQLGTVKHDRVLAVLRYCASGLLNKGQRVRIEHFVIDSLMKCGIGVDDYNRQKDFIDQLCAHARDTGVHIHLVAHARKGESENKIQDKFDIKGASEITDQVDNVFTLWRNKKKEEEVKKAMPDEAKMKEPDALLICSKQRHGEHEPKITLWFHQPSFQYIARQWAGPINFIKNLDDEIEAVAERDAIVSEATT